MYTVPRETQRFLKRYGGLTPFKQPQWRLIVSSERLIKEAGVWSDWDEGLSTKKRGGMNFSPIAGQPGVAYERYRNKPIRVVTEVRETEKYPHASGWILEKWFAASTYGTREEWYSYKASDRVTPMLGPYPECGDYEFQYGPWPKLPTTDMLQNLISQYSSSIANRKGTPFARAVEYLQRHEYAEQRRETKLKEDYESQFRDVLTPMNSTSLEAHRWRQDLSQEDGTDRPRGFTVTGPKQWLEDMQRKREVLRLRREALDIARAVIEQDPRSEGMTAYELELAACELCDRQVNDIKFQQKHDKGEPPPWQSKN